jgi:hypothetical protein
MVAFLITSLLVLPSASAGGETIETKNPFLRNQGEN